MNLNEVIFLSDIPSIDLHGLDRDSARYEIERFIKENKIMGNEIVCIVHGIGKKIIKDEIHNLLKKHKDVIAYKLFYNNNGCTIVKIKI